MIERRNFLTGLGAACGCTGLGMSFPAAGRDDDALGGDWDMICANAAQVRFRGIPKTYDPDPEAVAIIERMTRSVGLTSNFIIRKGKYEHQGTASAIRRGGKLFIVYDRAKFNMKSGHIPWTDLGILAHEIGHHVHNHFLSRENRRAKELEADKFSGFCCARIGASHEQSSSWCAIVSEKGSRTHPGRAERIKAVSEGWHDAQKIHRWQEQAHCAAGWEGPEIQIGGETCRIARQCRSDGPQIRLACETTTGRWEWR
tara:strand:- start:9836 stop:10606 length:771 start_codon:yes stop_codon:yes gene_type:complete